MTISIRGDVRPVRQLGGHSLTLGTVSTATTLNGTLNVGKFSASVHHFTGTETGFSVNLGDATTYVLIGQVYLFTNASTQTVAVRNNAGTLLYTLGALGSVLVVLRDKSTANGIWNINPYSGPLLSSVDALATNGLIVRTSASTSVARSIAAGSTKLSLTNADGVAGNPTLDVVEADLALNNIGGTLSIAKGGTNSTTTLNNNRIVVSSGGSLVEAAALTNGQFLIGSTSAAPVAAALTGTANQVVVTNGAGSVTLSLPQSINSGASPGFTGLSLSGLTEGSVLFAGASGAISQDNTNLSWNNIGKRLGIGGAADTYPLEVVGKLYSTTGYILGVDLSLIPIVGNQSVVTAFWGLQLVGNRQVAVDYTPSAVGANNVASVIIPNQQAAAIGLLVRGQTSQTGNLQEWQNVGGTTLASVLPTGRINAANAILLGSTTDTTLGNVRFNGLDLEFFRDTWRDITFAKHVFDDFLFSATATSQPLGWLSTTAGGGGTTINGASGNSFSGLIQTATGTTNSAAGVSAFQSGNGVVAAAVLGAQATSYEWRVRLPVVNTTPFYVFRVGLLDGAATGDPANGVYFTYIDAAAASAWQCVTRSGSVSTTTTSGVNVTAGTWFRVRVEVNAAGTSVAFYINSTGTYTLVATNTTNIPTAGLRLMAKVNKITSSTTSRVANLDYVLLNVER